MLVQCKKFLLQWTGGCRPPEYPSEYHAGPTTVWSLGTVLYSMVTGNKPFKTAFDRMIANVTIDHTLSRGKSTDNNQKHKENSIVKQIFIHHNISVTYVTNQVSCENLHRMPGFDKPVPDSWSCRESDFRGDLTAWMVSAGTNFRNSSGVR